MENFKDIRNRNFGAHLNRLMAIHKLTATDVCKKVWGTKVNQKGYTEAKGLQQYGFYMKGEAYPNDGTRKKLAEVFAVTVEELENPEFSKKLIKEMPAEEKAAVEAATPAPAQAPRAPSAPIPFPMLAPAPMTVREKPGKRGYEHLSVVPEPGQPGRHRLRFEAVVDAEAVAAFMLTINDLEAEKTRAHA